MKRGITLKYENEHMDDLVVTVTSYGISGFLVENTTSGLKADVLGWW